MPYDNPYNRMVADDVMMLNRKYIKHQEEANEGQLSGGFMGALAGMILPQILGAVASRVMGAGMKGGNGCEEIAPMPSAQYKCGDADRSEYDASSKNGPTITDSVEGGGGFARGTFRDTGYGRVLGAGKGGIRKYRKKKVREGAGEEAEMEGGKMMVGGCDDCEGGAKKKTRRKKFAKMERILKFVSHLGGGKKAMTDSDSDSGCDSESDTEGKKEEGKGVKGKQRAYIQRLKKRLEGGKKMTKRDDKALAELHKSGLLHHKGTQHLLGDKHYDTVKHHTMKIVQQSVPAPDEVISVSGGATLGLPKSIAGGKKRGRKSKMAGGLVPVANMKASYMAGFGKNTGGKGKRADIVKKVMAEKGLSMIQASKYVKEHSLY